MAIHTYAHLKQKILDTNLCKELMENYKMYKKGKGGFLNSIKSVLPRTMSWPAWFEANPEIREFLDSTVTLPGDPEDIIAYDIYKNLYDISKLKTFTPTAQKFVQLVKKALGKSVEDDLDALETYDSVLQGRGKRMEHLDIMTRIWLCEKKYHPAIAAAANRIFLYYINSDLKQLRRDTVKKTARAVAKWGGERYSGWDSELVDSMVLWITDDGIYGPKMDWGRHWEDVFRVLARDKSMLSLL